MKRVFKIAAIAALSVSAYSNTLMPEISRDGKSRNTSVLAVSQQKRSFIAGEYTTLTLETDTTPSVDVEYTIPSLAGGFATDKFTFEGYYQNLNLEIGSAEGDISQLSLLTGFRASETLTLGLGLSVNELSASIDDTILEFGGTLLVNGTTLGASVARHTVDNILDDGSYNVLTLGFGNQEKDLSWETGITYTSSGDGIYNGGSRLGVFAAATQVVNGVELDTSFDIVYGDYLDNNSDDNDYTSIMFDFDAEFLVGEGFYITPGLEYTKVDTPVDSANSSLLALTGDFGYRANKLDATFGLSYGTGDLEGIDVDGLGFKVNVGYAF